MADYTSIQIIKKAPYIWVFSDNTLPSGKYRFSNAYQDIGNEDLVSFTTRNGANIYNNEPYSIYSYIDELDSGNNFTPSSAEDLHTKLVEREFFGTNGGGGSVPTLQGLANSLFGSLFGRGGQVVIIGESELGFTTATIDGLFQNNIARVTTYYFTGTGQVTTADIADKVNNLYFLGNPTPIGINVPETTTPVIFIGVRDGVNYVFIFKKGKGVWGSEANPVVAGDFVMLSFYNTTPEDIESDPNATIIPLEDVIDNDFLAVANLTEWDFSISGEATDDGGIKTYYFTYTGEDGVEYFVRFIGEPGIYGGEETPFTAEMFTLTTSSIVTPEPVLNRWKKITVTSGQATAGTIQDDDFIGATMDYIISSLFGTQITDFTFVSETGTITRYSEENEIIIPHYTK